MANRRITELQELAGLDLADQDLFTVVRVSEVDPTLKNRKLTISGTKEYLNQYYLPRTGGTVSGALVVQGDLTVSGSTNFATATFTGAVNVGSLIAQSGVTASGTISGATITGSNIQGTNVNGVLGNFTTITGGTINIASGNFLAKISGVTITGASGAFTSLTGQIITGTTVNIQTITGVGATFTTVTGNTAGFTTVTGVTVTGTSGGFVTLTSTTGNFTSLTGVTTTGTTATFTSGSFTSLTGVTTTVTSGIFALGTAAAPSITISGYLNTGIYSPGADQLAISTNGTGRLFVDASGNVGVRTGSPVTDLQVVGVATFGNGFGGRLQATTDSNLGYIDSLNNTSTGWQPLLQRGTEIQFHTNTAGTTPTQKATIDSSGRLLVGTSSWSVGATAAFVGNSSSGAGNADVYFSRGLAATGLSSGQDVSVISFSDNAGGRFATIGAQVDGTPGASDYPGRLVFSTTADGSDSPTERMRISSAGTTTITSAASTAPFIANIGVSEVARIDSSGRLLVGTSSTFNNVCLGGTVGSRAALQVRTANNNYDTGATYINYSTTGFAPIVTLGLSKNNTAGINAIVAANDELGYLQFVGNDNTNFRTAAWIGGFVDGTPGTADMPGRLVFSTTADGAVNPTERMRISADGSISIATNSQPSTTNFGTFFGRTNLPGLIESFRNTNAAGTAAQFGGNLGYAQVMGDGDLENTNARYTGISDIKFKQNIEDASSQWDDIKAIQVRKYELIANPDRKHIGVIAQELEQTSPGLVIDREDLNGESYKSVAYSVLYMKAVKALQEAIARIETLEARLSTLEGA